MITATVHLEAVAVQKKICTERLLPTPYQIRFHIDYTQARSGVVGTTA
jgi:hypothetical protein